MTIKFYLYGSDGCHLCEQAEQLLTESLDFKTVTLIDIVEDTIAGKNLIELYGVHIPVLERLSDGTMLYWPFEQAQIQELDK